MQLNWLSCKDKFACIMLLLFFFIRPHSDRDNVMQASFVVTELTTKKLKKKYCCGRAARIKVKLF